MHTLLLTVGARPAILHALRNAAEASPRHGGPAVAVETVEEPAALLEALGAEQSVLVLDLAGCGGDANLARYVNGARTLNPALEIVALGEPSRTVAPTPEAAAHYMLALGRAGVSALLPYPDAVRADVWLGMFRRSPAAAALTEVREHVRRLFEEATARRGTPPPNANLLLRILGLAPSHGNVSVMVRELQLEAPTNDAARRLLQRKFADAGQLPPSFFIAAYKLVVYRKLHEVLARWSKRRLAESVGYSSDAFADFAKSRFGLSMRQVDRLPYALTAHWATELAYVTPAASRPLLHYAAPLRAHLDGTPTLPIVAPPALPAPAPAPPALESRALADRPALAAAPPARAFGDVRPCRITPLRLAAIQFAALLALLPLARPGPLRSPARTHQTIEGAADAAPSLALPAPHTMPWKIFKDHITEDVPGAKSRVGVKTKNWTPDMATPDRSVPFKLYDDDGELYYEGRITNEDINGPEERAFAPLDWARHDAGCTAMRFRNRDTGKWEVL